MLATLNAESTLTDRYQTTVPSPVRNALKLQKHDKIRYTVRENGSVLLERVTQDEADPAMGAFLEFLARDIKEHPDRLRSFNAGLHDKLQSLVAGVEVDMDEALSADDE